ncbi:Hsp20/alpha crystallin family protein [Georgenia sp. EYE_87]|uniref:Hsp20/alpha crystallin family protein n=1 Tax=Georgenia sp. EYE_87 TaxID=2853448 RepID=UPI002002ADDB|nr:Hsp20/alpha crystallin family protein [Georgenia sp. EYE_87]MCK6211719.1 Hsp20/alpha crystallin family protein [Georgenia sp. EYE_87]
MTTQPNDPGQSGAESSQSPYQSQSQSQSQPQSESQHSSVPARRSPRDLAEHLWDAFPFGDMPWPFREAGRAGTTPMRLEEFREGDHLVIRAELPGVDPDKDLDVTVDEGVLTISAQRQERSEQKQAHGYRSEFRYGRFERQIRLPKGADADAISASYRDGVLELRLPVPAETPPARKIDIRRS